MNALFGSVSKQILSKSKRATSKDIAQLLINKQSYNKHFQRKLNFYWVLLSNLNGRV